MTLDAREITQGITIELNIKNSREFGLRTWIADKLIYLASLIAWFNIIVSHNDNGKRLWQEFISECDDPFIFDSEYYEDHCFFCDGEKSPYDNPGDEYHDQDCIYLRAKNLVNE